VSDELAEAEEFAREIHHMYPAGQLDAFMTEYDRRGEALRVLEIRLHYAERRLAELDTALSPLCLCDHNPETTDGPQRECPLHGDGAAFLAECGRLRGVEKIVAALIERMHHDAYVAHGASARTFVPGSCVKCDLIDALNRGSGDD